MGKQHQSDDKYDKHDAEAGGEVRHIYIAHAKKCQPKSLHEDRERIQLHQPAKLRRHHRKGINHRCPVHSQRHAKGNQVCQVSIAGRQSRNDNSPAKTVPRQYQKVKRGVSRIQRVKCTLLPRKY